MRNVYWSLIDTLNRRLNADPTSSESLNYAFQLYYGTDSRYWQPQDKSRVIKKFGRRKGEILCKEIDLILKEVDKIKPDCTKHDLIGAAEHAQKEIANLYPDLSFEILKAIGNSYAFGYK